MCKNYSNWQRVINTVVPSLNNPFNKNSLPYMTHFFIYGALPHAIWPVMNDSLADVTNDLHIMTKTSHFTLYQWPNQYSDKLDPETVMFAPPNQRHNWAINNYAVKFQITCYDYINILLLFWNWKTFLDQKWWLFACTCIKNTTAMHFEKFTILM